jgi:hypothetical protein
MMMNTIENKLNEILSKDGDIATEILEVLEDFNAGEAVSLNSKLQNELKTRLSMNPMKEEVWDALLSIMQADELSEDVLNYLIRNHISLPMLCHMQLKDKWLMKLMAYDDAPVYTLARRYYLSDEYSSEDFLQFYNQCLRNKDDISLHLLDVYSQADKRGLLIFLCSNNKDFEHKERLQWYRVADQVRGITNSADITSIYKEYRNVGIVLTEIASNYFTPEEILLELLSVKGILYANKIRKNSEKTLKLKQLAEEISLER